MTCFFNLIFLAILVLVSYYDLTRRHIPNIIIAFLILLAGVGWLGSSFHVFSFYTVLVAVLVLALGFAAYISGLLGAGDVKLLTGCALVLGPAQTGWLIVYTPFFGGLLAIVYVMVEVCRRLRLYGTFRECLDRDILQQDIPYGIAISLAGISVIWSRLVTHCDGWVS